MKKRFSDEQIVGILKEAESANTHRDLIRKYNISDQTFYKWKRTYGGMSIPEVKRLKELEAENAKLKKLLYLGIQNAQIKWTMPMQNWSLTLSQLAIFFEGRIDKALKL